jgi:N-carbamoylputrescine amidase
MMTVNIYLDEFIDLKLRIKIYILLNNMSRIVKVASVQFSCSNNSIENIDKAIQHVRDAAKEGGNIILLQELFSDLYFCQEQKQEYFNLAKEEDNNEMISKFVLLAIELNIVLPISFFEKKNNAFYNSIVVINADGEKIGTYRKSHIPSGPGYQEKFYFTPGDTEYKVFNTSFAKIGVLICWDQWYETLSLSKSLSYSSMLHLYLICILYLYHMSRASPSRFIEPARILALQGAEILFYPTAIGSEPEDPQLDSSGHWERTIVGHSAANMIPVCVSNRIGTENFTNSEITFYGSSFITNNTGEILTKADRNSDKILVSSLELDKYQSERNGWGLFRDRRTDLYRSILTKDGCL